MRVGSGSEKGFFTCLESRSLIQHWVFFRHCETICFYVVAYTSMFALLQSQFQQSYLIMAQPFETKRIGLSSQDDFSEFLQSLSRAIWHLAVAANRTQNTLTRQSYWDDRSMNGSRRELEHFQSRRIVGSFVLEETFEEATTHVLCRSEGLHASSH